MMNVIIEKNKYLERFFKKNKEYEERLINEIKSNINVMIEERPHKIKTVSVYKYKDRIIYEYKIIIDKSFVCRVAYIIYDDDIIVFYLSTNIIKAKFTKEVSEISGVSK